MTRFAIYGVLLAIILCVLALTLGNKWGSRQKTGTQYMVADMDLTAGSFIPPQGIICREASADELKAGALNPASLLVCTEKTREALSNDVLRQSMRRGSFITRNILVKPTDANFLPTVLKPGYRAMAIRVTDVTGGAGLYRPGNLVDVLITVTGKRRNDSSPAMSKTLLQAARILAVNRDMGVPTGNIKNDDKDAARKKFGTVTLEVLPKQAEVLALGGAMGELSLALCSGAPDSSPRTEAGPTRADELVTPSGNDRTPASIKTIFGPTARAHKFN